MSQSPVSSPGRVVGRYGIFGEIASGGMATVHFGRLLGAVGFSRTVAIKRLHPQFAKDQDFVSMFVDEARLAARIQHPNVVPTIDVVALDDEELFLVMEYVQGESLARLLRGARGKGLLPPLALLGTVLGGALHGLHAAHEARSETGEPLGIVHRDVSPQNILVGVDGVARVLDFGVAKAAGRLQSTRQGQLKGKLSYMSPEQVRGGAVDRRTDVYAIGVVLWEALTGQPLFAGDNEAAVMCKLLEGVQARPSALAVGTPPAVDAVVMQALAMEPDARFRTAREMAIALERATGVLPAYEIGEWVEQVASLAISHRAQMVKEIESRASSVSAVSSTALGLGPAPGPGSSSDVRARSSRGSSGSHNLPPPTPPSSASGSRPMTPPPPRPLSPFPLPPAVVATASGHTPAPRTPGLPQLLPFDPGELADDQTVAFAPLPPSSSSLRGPPPAPINTLAPSIDRSTVEAVAPAPVASAPPRGRAPLALGAAAFLLVVIGAALVMMLRQPGEATDAPAQAASAPAAASAAPLAAPVETGSASAAPAVSASAAAPAAPSAGVGVGRKIERGGPAGVGAKPAGGRCSPPYTIDPATGIKKPKLECL